MATVLLMLRIFATREETCGTKTCGTAVSAVGSRAGRPCHSLVAARGRAVLQGSRRGRVTTCGHRSTKRYAVVLAWSLSLLAMCATASAQTVLFVNANVVGGNNDGTGWANAYQELQPALAAAVTGDQIWVAAGIYKPDFDMATGLHTADRTATFSLVAGVGLYGGFAGGETLLSQRDPTTNVSILSGDLLGDDGANFTNMLDNSMHVVTAIGTDLATILDGLTITSGHVETIGQSLGRGAGILLRNDATLTNCIITNNFAENEGGGLFIGRPTAPLVSHCSFISNKVFSSNGSAISDRSGNTDTITECIFRSNISGDGATPGNAAVMVVGSSTLIANSLFINNASTYSAGAFTYTKLDSAPFTIATPTVVNCTFINNFALTEGGGAIEGDGSSQGTFLNCTFSGNTSGNGSGSIILLNEGSSAVFENCILWNSPSPQLRFLNNCAGGACFLTLNFSCVQDTSLLGNGVGNISMDPLFFDVNGQDGIPGTLDDDLRLSAGSPCIDAANNANVPPDTADLDNDGNTTEPTPIDLAGNPRFFDDIDSPDCPQAPGTCGAAPIVDMGAFEFFPDCNNNGVPDMNELACGNTLSGWTGAGDGTSWSDTANWCPNLVPNNTMSQIFSVFIGPGAVITLDIDVTICSLDVDPTSSINVNAAVGKTLTVQNVNSLTNSGIINIQNNGNTAQAGGMISNSGTINITANLGTANLVPTSMGTMLTGGGTVRLFNPGTSLLGSLGGNVSLTNDLGHVVCGAGEVVGSFTNDGMVLADSPNNALTLRGIGTQRTNNRSIVATNGGKMRIGGMLNQGVGGALAVSSIGSVILLGESTLENATISGGTIRQTAGTVQLANQARLRDLTIEGELTVPGVADLAFIEGTIVNNGVIKLTASGGLNSILATKDVGMPGGGAAQFNGTGSLQLLNGSRAILESKLPVFPTITNGPNHLIEGLGTIRATLINNGTIRTNPFIAFVGSTLAIEPTLAGGLQINNGLMEASDFAILALNATIQNNGLISAVQSGTVQVNAPVTGSGSYISDHATMNISADITGTPGADVRFTVIGGTMTLALPANHIAVDGCGPIIVRTGSPALFTVDNGSLINASSWTIGDAIVGPDRATMELLNNSIGLVNGPVTVKQNGTLRIIGSSLTADSLTLDPGANLQVASSLALSGSLTNGLTDGTTTSWSWAAGSTLSFTGGQAASPTPCSLTGWATIEAASTDTGAGGGVNDFALRDIQLTAGSHVSMVDIAANHSPVVTEALYCDSLTLGAGAVLNLNGLNLYVGGVAVAPGALGGGLIVDESRAELLTPLGDLNEDGQVTVGDIPSFVAVLLGQDNDPVHICASDLNSSGSSDGSDVQAFVAALLGP